MSPSVIQVDVLHSKVSSLESNLKASVSANSQLQDQLAESRRAQALQGQRSLEDKDILKAQVYGLSVCLSVSLSVCLPACLSFC